MLFVAENSVEYEGSSEDEDEPSTSHQSASNVMVYNKELVANAASTSKGTRHFYKFQEKYLQHSCT